MEPRPPELPRPAATSPPFPQVAQRFARRALRSDLSRDDAMPDERAALGARGDVPLVATYATWRRAMLWVGGIALAITAALALPDWIHAVSGSAEDLAAQLGVAAERSITDDLDNLHVTLSTMLFAPLVVAAFFVLRAARQWREFAASRRSARIAWAVLFGVPVVAAVVPWSAGLGEEAERAMQAAEQIAQLRQLRQGIGLVIALSLFMKIGPAVIGLCSGIVRSSMAVKTLLPESPLPGWAAVAFAPVYGLLLIVVMVLVLQTSGSPVVVLALLALVAAPLSYLHRWRDVLRAHGAEEVDSVVRPLRDRAALLNLAGVVLLAGFMVAHASFSVLDALTFLFAALSSTMLMTLVAADLLLVLMDASWGQVQAFEGSERAMQLDRKLDELRANGLTRAGGTGFAPSAEGAEGAEGAEALQREGKRIP